MNDKITTLHRGLLWLAAITGALFGLAYYIAPKFTVQTLGLDATDFVALRTIGGFLLGEVVGASLSLRSGRWSEVRVATLYLMSWNLLNSLALFSGILFSGESLALLPNAILTAVLGLGFAFVSWQRRRK